MNTTVASCDELDALLVAAGGDFDGPGEHVRTRRLARRMFDRVLPPVTLGRYVLEDELGQGAMGVVFLAHDRKLDRRVVLKTIQPRLRSDPAYRDRLLAEAHALARLNHPAIVTVFDVLEHDGQVLVSMEHIEGPTLAVWLAEGPRSAAEIFDVFLAAGRGIAAAHRAQVVHRDFKPDNVVMGPGEGPTPKVVDFGLAYSDRSPTKDRELAAGTPRYMAPEVLAGAEASPRADQYAWAYCLTEALRDRGITPPPRIRDVLARGTSLVPEDRWPDIEQALAAVERARRRHQRRRRLWTAGAVLTGVAGLLGATLAAVNRSPTACVEGPAAVREAWSAESAASVKASLIATGRAHAAATFELVDAELTGFAGAWLDASAEACERVTANDNAGGALVCLRGRRIEYQTTIDRLVGSDGEVADLAMDAVLRLSAPQDCLDARTADASVALVEESPGADAVEALARARAVGGLGADMEAIEILEPLDAQLEGRELDGLRATALLELATSLVNVGEYEQAEERLYEARRLAQAAGYLAVEAAARAKLATVLARYRSRLDGAVTLLHATALPTDAELPEAAKRRLDQAWGIVHHQNGDHDRAIEAYRAALGSGRTADRHDAAATQANIAAALAMSGHVEEALVELEAALDALERAVGWDHPEVGEVAINLGFLYLMAEQPLEAEAAFDVATDVLTANYGANHPPLAHPNAGLGEAYIRVGDTVAALGAYATALELDGDQDELGPRRPRVLFGMARAHWDLGRRQVAVHYADQAFALAHAQAGIGIDPEVIRGWLIARGRTPKG